MPAEDDRELMLLASRGSREAFSALVERYERKLISYFLRQFGDWEFAEDCAQEVFLRLYRSRDRYEPAASFATFLFTIARNYSIDLSRSRSHRPRTSSLNKTSAAGEEEEWVPVNLIENLEPNDIVQGREQVRRLQTALERLPIAQREAVVLGVIQELPYADVAAILQVPIGTVKSRVHTAVLSLRRMLNPCRGSEATDPSSEKTP